VLPTKKLDKINVRLEDSQKYLRRLAHEISIMGTSEQTATTLLKL
jgi:hypothetical protein